MLAPPRSKVQDNIGLSISEEMKALAKTHKERRHRSKKKKKIKVNYAELLNIKVLKNIRREFVQKGGKHESLTADDFIDVLSEYINRSDVEAIYKKIDVNDDGMVDWEEFTGFLISAEGGGTADTGSRNVVQQFVLQREQEFQTHGAQQHSDLIEHIAYGKYPFPVLVTAGRDGKVLLWNPKSLAYMQSIDYRDKSTVFLDGVTKSMPRADIARMQSRGTNFIVKKNPSYFTAVDILPITGHICVSSADCCVNIYDSPSLELTGSLTSAADLPTTLKAFAVLDKIRCINTQYLAIGNSKGKIIVITLNENFIVASDGPLPKINNQEIWETAVKNKYKWKIHKDWVTQIMYISEINRLVSSSLDGTIVLSTIDTQPSGRVFSGHDSGVRCFGWSNASKIICSAGTDRSVLIWDPYTLQVAHRIESLTSMIVSIQINDLSQQIVIVLEEKIFKAWDSMTYEPLPSSEDPSIQLPRNRISASLWVPETEILYAAGNRVCSFRNANVNHEATADEDDDLCKVLYNRNFYEVVTVTKGGFVNVYFAGDGTPESKFLITNSMHQTGKVESTLSVIDAIFDKAQRRLIVVTNDSNEIQIWNFHSGLCLKSFRPRISHSLSQYPDLFPPDNKTSFNITCLFYEHTVTSSEKINKRMLMFGTNLGVVSVLVELPDDIAEEPSFNLVAQSGTANDNMKIRFPETVDVDIIKSEHNGLKTNSNHGYISNARDVTWLCESLTNHVLVAYRDGTVIDWNIDKGIRNVKIVPSEFLKGVSFMAFRRKFANNTSKEPTTADVNLASPREEQHLTPNFEKLPSQIEELTEDELRSMTEPPKLPDQISGDSNVDGQKIVKSSPIRKPKPNSSNNAVVKKMQPKVRTNGPKRVTTGEASRTLLATYGNHFEKQIAVAESGQESWVTNTRNGGYFKAAIVGVAKKNHDDSVSLNPLLPDILSPRGESEPSDFVHQGKTKVSMNNFGRPVPAGGSLMSVTKDKKSVAENFHQSHKFNAWGEESNEVRSVASNENNAKSIMNRGEVMKSETEMADALLKLVPPSTPLTHTVHANKKECYRDSMLIGKRTQTSEGERRPSMAVASSSSNIAVTCMVTLKNAKIAIGACTDSLFRFWDLNSVKVLCSCSVGLELKTVKSGGANPSTLQDMQLSCLTLSADEELLIGGYENGEIRIWIISMTSISNIRVTQKETMSGMSVPPIQLLNEWTGHESAIRSIEIISLDEENWGSHELYLISSGQDQGVHLWTVSGEHIGSFGTHQTWDLLEKLTWKVSTQNAYENSNHLGISAPTGPSAPSKSKPSARRSGGQTKKYHIAASDTETNYFRMATLHRHMEKVKIKNQKKLIDPSTTELHCDMVHEAQLRNPIADVSNSNPLKPSSPRKSRSGGGTRRPTVSNNKVKFSRE